MALTPAQMQQLQQLMMRQQEETSKPIVEFRAGLCIASGKSIRPDPRRGKVSILKEDSAVKFQWTLRPSNSVELSLILLPRQAIWERVKECKDGRVYVLKFRDGSVKHYFWLQEPKETDEKDDALAKQVNEAIVAGVSSSSSSSSSSGSSSAALADLNAMQIDPALLAEMGGDAAEQAALLSMIQQAAEENMRNSSTTAPQTPAPKASSTNSSSNAATGSTNATSNTSAASSSTSAASSTSGSGATAAATGAGGSGQQSALLSAISQFAAQFVAQQAQSETIEKQPRLNDIIDVDKVCALVLEDEKLFESLSALLPEGQRTKEDFKAHLRSPQFQSTLSRMSGILSTAQYGQLLASLALPTNTENIGVLGFLEAIQKVAKGGSNSNSSGSGADKK